LLNTTSPQGLTTIRSAIKIVHLRYIPEPNLLFITLILIARLILIIIYSYYLFFPIIIYARIDTTLTRYINTRDIIRVYINTNMNWREEDLIDIGYFAGNSPELNQYVPDTIFDSNLTYYIITTQLELVVLRSILTAFNHKVNKTTTLDQLHNWTLVETSYPYKRFQLLKSYAN
jgi:hypothetical protein